ncbi:EI24 domain-containing protein [Pokkaliibacter sp. CJK22405]|uniref:EI24 domain-containing protein n=1 Tax=Pokkaliibacter sp. CJK22405 TaxID=3384615 RepID=UPI003985098B
MSWNANPAPSGLIDRIISDLLSVAILKRALLPFLIGFLFSICAVVWAGVLLFGWGSGAFDGQSTGIDQVNTQAQAWLDSIPLIGVVLAFMVKGLIGIVASFLGIFVLGEGMVLVALFITAFLTPSIVKHIHGKHYAHLPLKGHGNLFGSILTVLWKSFLLLAALLVSSPLLFVPLINLVWFKALFYAYFRSLLALDVGENTLDAPTFTAINRWSNMPLFWFTFLSYLLSFLPFVNLFVPIIGVVALTHLFIQQSTRYNHGDIIGNLQNSERRLPQ